VLALGIKPVGATTWDNGNFGTYLPEQTTEIAKAGLLAQPNIESIFAFSALVSNNTCRTLFVTLPVASMLGSE
jgi:hypothetical protein